MIDATLRLIEALSSYSNSLAHGKRPHSRPFYRVPDYQPFDTTTKQSTRTTRISVQSDALYWTPRQRLYGRCVSTIDLAYLSTACTGAVPAAGAY